MIEEAIKDMTREEAETWLYRHGYGPGLAEEQLSLLDAAQSKKVNKPVAAKPTPAPVATPKVDK